MATRTDTQEQQDLWAIYDAALWYAEKHRYSNEEACRFLEADKEERCAVLDTWDQNEAQRLVPRHACSLFVTILHANTPWRG